MDKLTHQLRLKLRQLADENRQLREDNRRLEIGREKLLKDLEAKIVEANEAREMEAIYSSRSSLSRFFNENWMKKVL